MFDTLRTTILATAVALALVAGGVPVSAEQPADQPFDDASDVSVQFGDCDDDDRDAYARGDPGECSSSGGTGGSSGVDGDSDKTYFGGTPSGGIGASGCDCKDLL